MVYLLTAKYKSIFSVPGEELSEINLSDLEKNNVFKIKEIVINEGRIFEVLKKSQPMLFVDLMGSLSYFLRRVLSLLWICL